MCKTKTEKHDWAPRGDSIRRCVWRDYTRAIVVLGLDFTTSKLTPEAPSCAGPAPSQASATVRKYVGGLRVKITPLSLGQTLCCNCVNDVSGFDCARAVLLQHATPVGNFVTWLVSSRLPLATGSVRQETPAQEDDRQTRSRKELHWHCPAARMLAQPGAEALQLCCQMEMTLTQLKQKDDRGTQMGPAGSRSLDGGRKLQDFILQTTC